MPGPVSAMINAAGPPLPLAKQDGTALASVGLHDLSGGLCPTESSVLGTNSRMALPLLWHLARGSSLPGVLWAPGRHGAPSVLRGSFRSAGRCAGVGGGLNSTGVYYQQCHQVQCGCAGGHLPGYDYHKR